MAGELGGGVICALSQETLGGCHYSPALVSGVQLPVQGHREAEETAWLALLAQGAHHVQIEGNSPWEEQSSEQGTKKIANPGGTPRIAAPSPGHGTNPARTPRQCKEILPRLEPQVSPGVFLRSEV